MNESEVVIGDSDTEAKMLQAAEAEFLAKGCAGARTTSIAASAGVTHAMFHYSFRTKDKLFERIISEKIGVLKQSLLPAVMDIELPFDQYIKGIIDQHLDFIAANPLLPGFLVRELNSGTVQASAILSAMSQVSYIFLGRVDEKIRKAVAEGICCDIDAKALILDIVSLNIFPYLARPIVTAALDNCMADSQAFL